MLIGASCVCAIAEGQWEWVIQRISSIYCQNSFPRRSLREGLFGDGITL